MREVIRKMLERMGYRPLEAQNGQEALALYEEHKEKIALILSDVVMPESGGIDLAYALEERGAPQKIILLTGYPLGQEETPLPANIAGWVIKPPSLGHLSEAIQGALQ